MLQTHAEGAWALGYVTPENDCLVHFNPIPDAPSPPSPFMFFFKISLKTMILFLINSDIFKSVYLYYPIMVTMVTTSFGTGCAPKKN